MATIVGGIASSHTPTIGFALDTNKQKDPVWAPIFEGYKPVQQWLADKKPDVLFFIANDHITSFFFDHYSHFTLGVGDKYWVADEGGGARKLPPIKGQPQLAKHVANGLVADEFALSLNFMYDGIAIAMRIPRMITTTRSSMRVNPFSSWRRLRRNDM